MWIERFMAIFLIIVLVLVAIIIYDIVAHDWKEVSPYYQTYCYVADGKVDLKNCITPVPTLTAK